MKYLLFVALCIVFIPVYASDYENGLSALNRGDNTEALELFEKSCGLGESTGCIASGYMYSNGIGVIQNYTTAKGFFESACAKGSMDGCSDLAHLYYNGYGVEHDYKLAYKLYRLACSKESLSGCHVLANQYADGFGVEKNWSEAVKLYTKVCDSRKIESACYDLGLMYYQGEGILGKGSNPSKAEQLVKRACRSKVPQACQLQHAFELRRKD